MNFYDAFSRFGLSSFQKQMRMAKLVKGSKWSMDYAKGVLWLEGIGQVPVEIFGTWSNYDNSWLWAWANESLQNSPIGASLEIFSYGKTAGIPELTEDQIDLQDGNAHEIAMVSTGILGGFGYYRCPYDGGAGFVIIRKWPFGPVSETISASEAVSTALDFFNRFSCNHRLALDFFLKEKNFRMLYENDSLTAQDTKGRSLYATFDQGGNLLVIENDV